MVRKSIGILVAAASLSLAGCGRSSGDMLSPFARNLAEVRLQAAERQWLDRRPGAYRLTESRSCECQVEVAAPMVVTVMLLFPIEGGDVAERVDVAHYESDGSLVPEQYRSAALTVQQLFALIRDALDRHAARLDVEYDAQYGYPAMISIDYDAQMVDDEITIRARDLQGMLTAGQ
jgi:hypothetical protein